MLLESLFGQSEAFGTAPVDLRGQHVNPWATSGCYTVFVQSHWFGANKLERNKGATRVPSFR